MPKSGYKLNPEGARGYRSQVAAFTPQGTTQDVRTPRVPEQEDPFAEMGDLVSSLKGFEEKFKKGKRDAASIEYQALMAQGFNDDEIAVKIKEKADGTGALQSRWSIAVVNAFRGENAALNLKNAVIEEIYPQIIGEDGKIDATKFHNYDYETEVNKIEERLGYNIKEMQPSEQAAYAGTKNKLLIKFAEDKAASNAAVEWMDMKNIVSTKFDDILLEGGHDYKKIEEFIKKK